MGIFEIDEQQVFEKFNEEVALRECTVTLLALTKKLGELTDKERDRAFSACEVDTYNHPWGYERRVFHAGEFLVGFSTRWNHDELQVVVKTLDGTDSMFCVNKRQFQ